MIKGKTYEFLNPVLKALKGLGGSARPREVENWIVENVSVPKEILDTEIDSGGSRFRNRVHWARFYLAKAGLIDSSVRGVWTLTEKGAATELNHEQSAQLFQRIHSQTATKPTDSELRARGEEDGAGCLPENFEQNIQIREILMNLLPEGFERLCQRLLREAGFDEVHVTSRTRDGGIDGHGVLRINPLVSFSVSFQCKRYSGPVGAAHIRDFRGAIIGRADKGIFLTTSEFTKDAKEEAARDGATPIELVDGDALIEMLKEFQLGMIPRTIYDVDEKFFEEFGYQI